MRGQYAVLAATFLEPVTAGALQRFAGSLFPKELSKLEKRADSTTIPAPVNVEPSQYWEGDDGPWSSFTLQVGTPKQDVRVMISTAGYNTWTINEALGCPSGTIVGCEASRGQPFLTNESLTWVPNSQWQLDLEDNLGLDSTAYFGFDTITLGYQGSGLPTAEHMVIANLGVDTYWLGQFGLNPMPTNFSTFNDPQPSFMTALKSNNTIPSLSYGYTAGAQYRYDGVFGSLVLGGYDSSKFNATNVTIPFGADVGRDLLIGVQDISTGSGTSLSADAGGGFYAFIDSTVAQLWLPTEVCEAFETTFGITYDETTELYLINDTTRTALTEANPSVTFTLGASSSGGDTVAITLPYAAFDLQVTYPIVANGSSYYFPLKRAANATQYTLGRAFLQEAYLTADYGRRNFTVAPCFWEENAVSSIHTILPIDDSIDKSSGSGLSSGAIAGIAVGAAAIVAAVAAAIWFVLYKRRKNNKARLAELEAKSAGMAAHGGSSSGSDSGTTTTLYESNSHGTAMKAVPVDGELGTDSEIHELMEPQNKGGLHEYYGVGGVKFNADGTMSSTSGAGYSTWQSQLSEVEGNNEPIYEMQGSEVQELPDSRRQSWAGGEGSLQPRGMSQATLPPSYTGPEDVSPREYTPREYTRPEDVYPRDEKTGLH